MLDGPVLLMTAIYSELLLLEFTCKTRTGRDLQQGVLLGDSGYPCRPFLLTPYRQPEDRKELRFNRSHISTRSTIERTFGIWKKRFNVQHSEVNFFKFIYKLEFAVIVTITKHPCILFALSPWPNRSWVKIIVLLHAPRIPAVHKPYFVEIRPVVSVGDRVNDRWMKVITISPLFLRNVWG